MEEGRTVGCSLNFTKTFIKLLHKDPTVGEGRSVDCSPNFNIIVY